MDRGYSQISLKYYHKKLCLGCIQTEQLLHAEQFYSKPAYMQDQQHCLLNTQTQHLIHLQLFEKLLLYTKSILLLMQQLKNYLTQMLFLNLSYVFKQRRLTQFQSLSLLFFIKVFLIIFFFN
ncbi:transmembrane protein, putative (macronuclear) [Tetrahymena thermophila SB210]|uniref:Transmembrane protein, putative n=1 Tax=Tetrahymena thermophila (strain SB210) TaxID=312017 RepID=W7X7Y7_TETTS|nr:transmembrane protein, putative [Tetrahymena thermophila SB210]EWS73452.1 transmembrane protein, putative [Tetrahymena thermophila SB210]|eukprot:XP_012654023.1 transmembrane protein, putative [Tetrahymena thermophila SB210]